jgi:hypothetical protein
MKNNKTKHFITMRDVYKKHPFLVLYLFFLLFTNTIFANESIKQKFTSNLLSLYSIENEANFNQLSDTEKLYWKNKQDLLFWNLNQLKKNYSIENEIDNRIDLLKESDIADEVKKYYLGEHYLFLAILEYEQGNNLSAAKAGLKAFNYYKASIKANPDYLPPYLGYHYINTAVSFAPSSYHWIISLLGFDIDKNKSIKALNNLYNKFPYQQKVEYQLLYLYAGKKFGLQKVNNINGDLLNILEIRNLMKRKKISNAKTKIHQLKDHIHLKHFLLGKCLFIENNWSGAKKSLHHFLQTTSSKSHVNITNYYLYQIAIIENNPNQEKYKESTLNLSKFANAKDKWAKKDCNSNISKSFIKIRNAYDRGDYKTVLKNTEHIAPTKKVDFRIYYYQLKSLTETGNVTKAEKVWTVWQNHYKGKGKKNYYQPKALIALTKAFIPINKSVARKYLKELKSFNGYTYQDIESEINYLEWQLKNKK